MLNALQDGVMYLIILIIILIVYLVWRFGTRNFGYWKKKGIKYIEPVFFFGNMYKQFTHQLSLSEQMAEWYNMFPEEKYVGVHMANDVGLVLRDPELIKRVLSTDFQYFPSRGINSHKDLKEPLSKNIFSAEGDIWKLVRQQISPIFTSAKLKAMFPLIVKTADKMLSVTEPGTHDVKELLARYTTDFIGTCAFGLEIDTLSDESSRFRCLGKRIIEVRIRDAFAHIAKRIAPEVFKYVYNFPPEVEKDIHFILKQILNNRNYKPSGRHDFIDYLLEIKQKGNIVGESMEQFNPDGTAKTVEIELDELLMVALIFTFFGAGFETTSSASSFLLHELAFNPEIQEQCHHEIDGILSRHGGKISYEAIKEINVLENVLKETLRLHPSPGQLLRKCEKTYTFPGTDLTIDKGVLILIPLLALHYDPRFFEDPESFKPDRFVEDEVVNIQKYVYLPFGGGLRACIGERLGYMQVMVGVATLLSRFRVEPAPSSRRRPLYDPRSFFVENIKGGLPLTLVRRQPQH